MEFPGPGDEIISRKGATMDRDAFEGMKDDYYRLRDWDCKTGLQTKEQLTKLGLEFICEEMEQGGLLKKG